MSDGGNKFLKQGNPDFPTELASTAIHFTVVKQQNVSYGRELEVLTSWGTLERLGVTKPPKVPFEVRFLVVSY